MEKLDRKLTMDNQFIERYEVLSTMEGRLLIEMIANVKKDDEDFDIITLVPSDFTTDRHSKRIDALVDELATKHILPEKSNKRKRVYLFDQFEYTDSKIQARLSQSIKKYLIGLKSHFTQISETTSIGANEKGGYVLKIYWLISSRNHSGVTAWKVSLKDFREMLHLEEGRYKRQSHFDSRILKPALKYMNSDSINMGLSVEKIKRGRTVESLKFTWENPKAHDVPNKPSKRPSSKAKQASSKPKEDSKQALTMANVNGIRERLNREAFGRHVFNDRVQRLKAVGLDSSIIFKVMCLPNSVANSISGCCPPPDNSTNPEGFVISKIKDTCDPKGIFWKGLQEMGL